MKTSSTPISPTKRAGSRGEIRLRWAGLGLSLAPIVGAFLYNSGLRLTPQRCFFQQMMGFPGPTCGMTRSFMAIARGDWQQAWSYHLFGPLLFGICLVVAVQTTAELLLGRRLIPPGWRSIDHPRFMAIGLLLFLAYYALRLYVRDSADILSWSGSETLLWQQFVAGAKAL